MKMPPVGWAFFGLAVLVLAGYVLNRGIFIGSDVRSSVHTSSTGYVTLFQKHCRYLHFTGTSEDEPVTWRQTSAEAERHLCRMFDN